MIMTERLGDKMVVVLPVLPYTSAIRMRSPDWWDQSPE